MANYANSLLLDFQTRAGGVFSELEMRDKKSAFDHIDKAVAATGVKISAPNLDNAISGMPVRVCNDQTKLEEVKNSIREERI